MKSPKSGRVEGTAGFSLQKTFWVPPLRLSAVKKYYSAFSAAIHIDT